MYVRMYVTRNARSCWLCCVSVIFIYSIFIQLLRAAGGGRVAAVHGRREDCGETYMFDYTLVYRV